MAKTLRVRTREGWTTKPVADLPENRLTAAEVDDTFLGIVDDYANQADRLKGAGMLGFDESLAYEEGTAGKSLAKVFNSRAYYAEDFGNVSASDATEVMQDAVNAAAAAGVPLYTKAAQIIVAGLTLPSNIELHLGKTVLKRKDGANVPLLRNSSTSFTSGTYGNTNIKIYGGTLDFNGGEQSNTGTDGAWLVGCRFVGVYGLEFDSTVFKNSRRFNIFLCNCRKIRAYGTEIENNEYIDSANKDGWHINGKVSDFYADVIRVKYAEDDAFALNADDIDFGGDLTVANIIGPIDDIRIGRVELIDSPYLGTSSRNGVRLLSATQRIRNVYIGEIVGNASVYALNMQDYGLGTESWYQNIRIGTVDCVFALRPYAEATMAMVNVEMPNHRTDAYSNISIGSIHRWQNDVDGQDRPTVNYTARRSELKIGLISEFNCSHLYSTVMWGAKEGAKYQLERFQRWASRTSGGIYGSVVRAFSGVNTIDLIDVANVQADQLQHVALIQNTVVAELSIDTLTPTNDAPIYLSDSTVQKLYWKSNQTPSYGLQSSRYTKVGTSAVQFERPAPLTCTTSTRPVNAAYGDQCYDGTLGKPIWWFGEWRDSAGVVV